MADAGRRTLAWGQVVRTVLEDEAWEGTRREPCKAARAVTWPLFLFKWDGEVWKGPSSVEEMAGGLFGEQTEGGLCPGGHQEPTSC